MVLKDSEIKTVIRAGKNKAELTVRVNVAKTENQPHGPKAL